MLPSTWYGHLIALYVRAEFCLKLSTFQTTNYESKAVSNVYQAERLFYVHILFINFKHCVFSLFMFNVNIQTDFICAFS